jgi:hypothetical protein
MQVNDNGTVCLKVNAVENTYNIRRIIPCHTSPDPDHGGNAICGLLRREGHNISEVMSL